ncbi:MAG: hypothetical protein JWP74_3245 [Marmoricola sp.]|nr:hypothetical protein [Marmoricola sp.]
MFSSRTRLLGAIASVVVVSAITVVACLTLGGSTDSSHSTHSSIDRAPSPGAAPALAAAKAFAIALTTYDYTTVDDYLAGVARLTTAPYAGQFASSQATLRSAITLDERTSASTVTGAQILSATPTSAEVKVTIEAKYTSSEDSTPQPSTQVYDLTLVRRGTTWLVSDVASS